MDAIDKLAAMLAKIDLRLSHLETAPRAGHTSVRNGFMRFMTPGTAENPKVYIGTAVNDVALTVNDEDGGSVGEIYIGTNGGRADVAVQNPERDNSGYALRIFDGRMTAPLITSAWQIDGFHTIDAQGRPTTTSGSYDSPLWRSLCPITTGTLFASIDVVVGAGITTAAVRLEVETFGGSGSGGAQTLHEETGITTTSNFDDAWAVPESVLSPAESPIGRQLEVRVYGRVTGGAGTLAVIPRLPLSNWP